MGGCDEQGVADHRQGLFRVVIGVLDGSMPDRRQRITGIGGSRRALLRGRRQEEESGNQGGDHRRGSKQPGSKGTNDECGLPWRRCWSNTRNLAARLLLRRNAEPLQDAVAKIGVGHHPGFRLKIGEELAVGLQLRVYGRTVEIVRQSLFFFERCLCLPVFVQQVDYRHFFHVSSSFAIVFLMAFRPLNRLIFTWSSVISSTSAISL